MASIQPVRSKDPTSKKPRFQARVKMRGHQHFSTFPTRDEAKDWGKRVETSIKHYECMVCAGERAARNPAQNYTVEDLLKRYTEYLERDKPQQVNARAGHLKFWKQELGAIPLAELGPSHIVEARDKLRNTKTQFDRPRSPADVNRHVSTLSHALNLACSEWELLSDNPARRVRKLQEPQGRVRFLSDDERKALLTACKESQARWLYPIVVLALATGMRQGEILELTWERVDFERGWITLDHTKNAERRGVPLAGHTLATLKEYGRVRQLGTSLVFPRPRKAEPTNVNPVKPAQERKDLPVYLRDAWDAAVKAAKLDNFHFHDLRHSCASYLAMQGRAPGEIAAVLGHKTLQMVRRYSHLSNEHTAGVVAALDARLFGQAK